MTPPKDPWDRIWAVRDLWEQRCIRAMSILMVARDKSEEWSDGPANKMLDVMTYSLRQSRAFLTRREDLTSYRDGKKVFSATRVPGDAWSSIGEEVREELVDWKTNHKKYMKEAKTPRNSPGEWIEQLMGMMDELLVVLDYEQIPDRRDRRVARALFNSITYTKSMLEKASQQI